MTSDSPAPVLVDPDVLAQYRRDAAYCAGQLSHRQLRPLTDNPHKRGSPEWHSWVSGWTYFRDLVEERDQLREECSRLQKTLAIRQRTLESVNEALVDAMDRAEEQEERAEFAEQAVKDAMETGLARVVELEAALTESESERGYWGRCFEDALEDIDRLREEQLARAEYALPPPGTPYIPASPEEEAATRPARYARLMEARTKMAAEEAADPEPGPKECVECDGYGFVECHACGREGVKCPVCDGARTVEA